MQTCFNSEEPIGPIECKAPVDCQSMLCYAICARLGPGLVLPPKFAGSQARCLEAGRQNVTGLAARQVRQIDLWSSRHDIESSGGEQTDSGTSTDERK